MLQQFQQPGKTSGNEFQIRRAAGRAISPAPPVRRLQRRHGKLLLRVRRVSTKPGADQIHPSPRGARSRYRFSARLISAAFIGACRSARSACQNIRHAGNHANTAALLRLQLWQHVARPGVNTAEIDIDHALCDIAPAPMARVG